MTDQMKDSCKYLGSEYPMPVCLSFPVDGVKIEELSNTEFADYDTQGVYLSTACWRNYVATWEIRDNQLFLVQIEGKYRLVNGEPIVANWFTGEFELPQGDLVDCNIELGFQLKYTKAVTLHFVSGVLVESIVRDID